MTSLNTILEQNTASSEPPTTTTSFERKTLSDGSSNPKYVDVLDEDKPLAGQKFSCISFLSHFKPNNGTLRAIKPDGSLVFYIL